MSRTASLSSATYRGIEIRIATTIDELMQCFAVRSAAFLGRENEPYEEEFDGNDLTAATHLLALDNGVPVGTMRVRILAGAGGGVATWQRFATLPNGKLGMKVLNALADAAADFTRFKRIDRVVGEVADERLLRFWERFGFERTGEAPSYYNGRAYHKIEGHFGRANAGLIDEGVGEAEAFYRWCETSPVSVVSQAA